MNVLVTGSSGYLGAALVARGSRRDGHAVVGLDPNPGPATGAVGSAADRSLVASLLREHRIEAILHAGALHKPDVARRSATEFVAANVQGTLNLLEEAVAPGSKVDRFVFTSTTSLMITREMRAHRDAGRPLARARWMTEEIGQLAPRNIYGVTKLAAEKPLHHDPWSKWTSHCHLADLSFFSGRGRYGPHHGRGRSEREMQRAPLQST